MVKQKRDNAYFEARLKVEHSAAYADFQAGGYPSLRAALIATGLKKPRPRVREMQNAWKKSSRTEREDFVHWLKANYSKKRMSGVGVPVTGTPSGTAAPKPAALDSEGRLKPWAKARLQKLLDLSDKSVCRAAFEMGGSIRDASLRGAIDRGWKVTSIDEAALEDWIERESIRHGLS